MLFAHSSVKSLVCPQRNFQKNGVFTETQNFSSTVRYTLQKVFGTSCASSVIDDLLTQCSPPPRGRAGALEMTWTDIPGVKLRACSLHVILVLVFGHHPAHCGQNADDLLKVKKSSENFGQQVKRFFSCVMVKVGG